MGFSIQEVKYMFFATLFAFVVFGWVIPFVVTKQESITPLVQFLIFNIGIFLFLNIFLKAKMTDYKINISGTLGVLALFMALDIMTPPLLVNPSGELATGNVALRPSASDWIFGYLGQMMGIKGFSLYLFTYIAVPLILLIISARLLPNFVRHL